MCRLEEGSSVSRQLEQALEARTSRRHQAVVRAVEFELVGALSSQGAELYGFSVKIEDFECLMTLRAVIDGVHSISFVGAEDLVGVMLKAVHLAKSDRLRWRADKYVGKKD